MLISSNRFLNTPIVSLQTGAPLGQVAQPIIDPRQLHIIAFHCSGSRINGAAILHTADIREVSNIGLIVDSADSIMPPDDLVRLKEVTNLNFTLIGKPVVDTNRHKLGRVESFSIEINSFYVMKLTVGQSIMRSFWGGNLLIDRSQIVEITDKKIIVQAVEIRSKETEAPKPIIENPFRQQHHHPQPDGSQAKVAQD